MRHRNVVSERAEPQVRRPLAGWECGVVMALTIGLALAFAACSPGKPVTLLTGDVHGCYLANTTGLLIPDPQAGTAIVSEDMSRTTVPVRWPAGFTGRKSGDQVEVLDASGNLVARTGRRYELLGGYDGDGSWAACVDGVYPPAWPSPR